VETSHGDPLQTLLPSNPNADVAQPQMVQHQQQHMPHDESLPQAHDQQRLRIQNPAPPRRKEATYDHQTHKPRSRIDEAYYSDLSPSQSPYRERFSRQGRKRQHSPDYYDSSPYYGDPRESSHHRRRYHSPPRQSPPRASYRGEEYQRRSRETNRMRHRYEAQARSQHYYSRHPSEEQYYDQLHERRHRSRQEDDGYYNDSPRSKRKTRLSDRESRSSRNSRRDKRKHEEPHHEIVQKSKRGRRISEEDDQVQSQPFLANKQKQTKASRKNPGKSVVVKKQAISGPNIKVTKSAGPSRAQGESSQHQNVEPKGKKPVVIVIDDAIDHHNKEPGEVSS